jgi:carboxymethylenebutenolidase
MNQDLPMSSISDDTSPLTQIEIDQRVFDVYDEYCHGRMDRREFLTKSAAVTAGGLAMAQALLPRYARAQTISFTDLRIKARYVSYPSPGGTSGTMRGYLVQPAGNGPFPTVQPKCCAEIASCVAVRNSCNICERCTMAMSRLVRKAHSELLAR